MLFTISGISRRTRELGTLKAIGWSNSRVVGQVAGESVVQALIGGAAGAVPVMVGWAAVTDSLGWTPVVLFVAMFLWTPPHFWALAIRYADDYRAAMDEFIGRLDRLVSELGACDGDLADMQRTEAAAALTGVSP